MVVYLYKKTCIFHKVYIQGHRSCVVYKKHCYNNNYRAFNLEFGMPTHT